VVPFLNYVWHFRPAIMMAATAFEEISIFSSGGHLGYRTALTETIMKRDHLRIIQTNLV
jgi:hypothetical protein